MTQELTNSEFTISPEAMRSIDILYVEDELSIQKMQARNFREQGLLFRVASNGMEALRMLEEKAADVMFTDFHMPGMNGAELAEQVKAKFPQMFIVLLSAGGFGEDEVNEFREKGIDFYLPKPFSLVALEAILQEVGIRKVAAAQQHDI